MTFSNGWEALSAAALAIGLILTGYGLVKGARIARSDFMLKFYREVQRYNEIHVRLLEGWPDGPSSENEWNEVRRYLGLFAALWATIEDGAYPIKRVDGHFSHRIIALVLNLKIYEYIECSDVGQRDFRRLWLRLESCEVYRHIARLRATSGLVVPPAPSKARAL
jgi:hypothetical protein